MIVIVGASASGKTEIAKILIKEYQYHKCVTTTTRLPRVNEVDGVDYHFMSKEDFLKLVHEKKFVEVNNYRDRFYGIQKRDIDSEAIVIVDPNGANELISQLSDEVFVVLVESSLEKRKTRMIFRGDNINEINKRLESDDELFSKDKLLRIDLLIENEHQSLEELALLIHQKYRDFFNR